MSEEEALKQVIIRILLSMNIYPLAAEQKPVKHVFVEEFNKLCAQENIYREIQFLFFCCFMLSPCCHRCLLLIFTGCCFVLHSHNTKTTTWLDPRLAKKAKPPEKCEDGGTCHILHCFSTRAFTKSINHSTCIYTWLYLCCMCPAQSITSTLFTY